MEEKKIRASRSTYESWAIAKSDLPEQATKENWFKECVPYNVYAFAMKVYREMSTRVQDARNIRIIVLDEEYDEWLEHECAFDDPSTRVRYKKEIDIGNADRLLKKNHMDRAYHVLFLPVSVEAKGDDAITIPDELAEIVCRSLQVSFETFYGDRSVYVPGCVLTPEEAEGSETKLQMLAAEYFENGICLPFKRKMEFSACDAAILFIPFVYKAPCYSADIDLGRIGRDHPEWLDPADVSLRTEIVFEDDLQELLDCNFHGIVGIGKELALAVDIEDVYEDMQERMMSKLRSDKKKKVKALKA